MRRFLRLLIYLSVIIAVVFTALTGKLCAQPIPDTTFVVELKNPLFKSGFGPLVMIDDAHHNWHKKEVGLFAFTRLLEQDGYQVKPLEGNIKKEKLKESDILVIVNPLHESDLNEWVLPNPSAYHENEVSTLVEWIKKGGSLLLVADHMPFPGAVQDIANELGIEWKNGFEINLERGWPPSLFTRKEDRLGEHFITSSYRFKVDSIVSYTGSAFRWKGAEPLLKLSGDHTIFLPDTAWNYDQHSPQINGKGWLQGAYKHVGNGKVVALGEAAMITAQRSLGRKIGINDEEAKYNWKLVLNMMQWLAE